MTILIAYATIEGQTGKIARFVRELLREAGHSVRLFDTSDGSAEPGLDAASKVILAAPVHERRHPDDFEIFVTARRADLAKRQTLFLSVSMSAAFPEGREEAQDYVTEMVMRTGFEPTRTELVAGAIRTERYDYYATQVLRHVVLDGRPVDPSAGPHEFTDWAVLESAVREFAEQEAEAAG